MQVHTRHWLIGPPTSASPRGVLIWPKGKWGACPGLCAFRTATLYIRFNSEQNRKWKNKHPYLRPCWARDPRRGAPPYPADRVSFRLIKGLCLEEQSIRWAEDHSVTVGTSSTYSITHAAKCCVLRVEASRSLGCLGRRRQEQNRIWTPEGSCLKV